MGSSSRRRGQCRSSLSGSGVTQRDAVARSKQACACSPLHQMLQNNPTAAYGAWLKQYGKEAHAHQVCPITVHAGFDASRTLHGVRGGPSCHISSILDTVGAPNMFRSYQLVLTHPSATHLLLVAASVDRRYSLPRRIWGVSKPSGPTLTSFTSTMHRIQHTRCSMQQQQCPISSKAQQQLSTEASIFYHYSYVLAVAA